MIPHVRVIFNFKDIEKFYICHLVFGLYHTTFIYNIILVTLWLMQSIDFNIFEFEVELVRGQP